MRPDLDEYEGLNPQLSEQPRGRAMSWLVLGVAVVGFAALAYYAYQSGSQAVGDGQMLVVKAQEGPIKQEPVDAGGEQFPHKDKTIYDALAANGGEVEKVETLLPAPEEPVIPEPAVGNAAPVPDATLTSSFVSRAETPMTDAAVPVKKEPAKPVDAVAPLNKPQPVTPPAAPVAAPVAAPEKTVEVSDATVATVAKPVVVTPTIGASSAVQEAFKVGKQPAATGTVEKKPEPAKAAEMVKKAEPAKAPPAPASGNFKIQLGAYKSDAEARQNWSRVIAKHGDVVKGSAIVVQADVGGVTYHRLRAGGFASADAAKKACAALSARGQGCFFAGK